MTDVPLVVSDFSSFFEAIHGTAPFPWQTRLLKSVASEGTWPKVLDLPTGVGKTAAIDIALFHLALDLAKGGRRRAPLRIAFVVDRRLVVDDAHRRAERLAEALRASAPSDVVRCVAGLLSNMATAGQDPARAEPLVVRRLRGGMPREDDWAHTPAQPTVLCSTVDQVGSRLLFRGYGVSDRMKPIHAGLLGSDCLLLLDEAHLSEPFRQTLDAIGQFRLTETPWQAVTLSATPGEGDEEPFALAADDRSNAVLARRLAAEKPARLFETTKTAADAPFRESIIDTVLAIVNQADGWQTGTENPAIGVVVNRVRLARQVYKQLSQDLGDTADTILLIGPSRAADRHVIEHRLTEIKTGSVRALVKPLVIVSTQCIEAGVDFDLDGLVTQAAPLDALRQRFGRLNRAGREITACAAVVAPKADIGRKADDPVYGDRIGKTWSFLLSVAEPETGSAGIVDFGIDGVAESLANVNMAELAAPRSDAPILMPAYVDLFSQTSPVPACDPEVALFLHGPERSSATVQIIWRADIGLSKGERSEEILSLMPPRSGEAIEVPLTVARAWLRLLPDQPDFADVAQEPHEESRRGIPRLALRWAGSDSPGTDRVDPSGIKTGDVIVVPAGYGGCDVFGWDPTYAEQVRDVADPVALAYGRRRYAVRLHRATLRQALAEDAEATPRNETRQDRDRRFDNEAARLTDRVSKVLMQYRESPTRDLLDALYLLDVPPSLKARIRILKEEAETASERVRTTFPYDPVDGETLTGVIMIAPRGLTGRAIERLHSGADVAHTPEASAPVTEDDRLGSTPGFAQTLEEHSQEVEGWAGSFAGRLGLPRELVSDISLAAALHDAGKADPRFQAMLAGGDRFGWDESRVYAKSVQPFSPRVWSDAGLPERWRHEALSVRIALAHPRFAEANDPDLVLWLIGTHHGFGRPFFPHTDPWDGRDRTDMPEAAGLSEKLAAASGPQSPAFDFEGRDWVQLFVTLQRRYGPWELARLESVLRLADHRASEAAELRKPGDTPTDGMTEAAE